MSVTFLPDDGDSKWARENYLNVTDDSARTILELLDLPSSEDLSGTVAGDDLLERIARGRSHLEQLARYLNYLEPIALRALQKKKPIVWS
jgi:hypothetical protein